MIHVASVLYQFISIGTPLNIHLKVKNTINIFGILLISDICFPWMKQLWDAEYFSNFDQFRFCFDWSLKNGGAIPTQISKLAWFRCKLTTNPAQCSFWFSHEWNDMINQIVTTLKLKLYFRLNRCCWRMLKTKYVNDTFKMILTDLAVIVTNMWFLWTPTSRKCQ